MNSEIRIFLEHHASSSAPLPLPENSATIAASGEFRDHRRDRVSACSYDCIVPTPLRVSLVVICALRAIVRGPMSHMTRCLGGHCVAEVGTGRRSSGIRLRRRGKERKKEQKRGGIKPHDWAGYRHLHVPGRSTAAVG